MRWFKTLSAFFLALVVPVQAEDGDALLQLALHELPECAIGCLVPLISLSACQLTDFYCIAHDVPLNAEIELCLKSNCTIREQLSAIMTALSNALTKNATVAKNFSTTAYGLPVRDHTKLISYSGTIAGGLAFTAITLRIWSRLPCFGGIWGWDDWTMVVVMVVITPLTVLSVVREWAQWDLPFGVNKLTGTVAHDGLGRDIWTVPFDKITQILHIYYFDEIFYVSSITLTKISVLLFYLRIFPDQRFRRLVYVAIAYCVGYMLETITCAIFQCKPVSYAWTFWDGEAHGKCLNLNLLVVVSAALNIIGDLVVICLPIYDLSKLLLSRRKKAEVMLMFLGGGFVTIVSVLRFKFMIQFANSRNVTWDYTPIGYWSTLEIHTGIIVACLPAIKSLQRRLFSSCKAPDSYYAGAPGGYKYPPKGGSAFPATGNLKINHMDLGTVTSQLSTMRSRDRSKDDREFVPLKEYEHSLGDLPTKSYGPRNTIGRQPERAYLHGDDSWILSPMSSTDSLPPQVMDKEMKRNSNADFARIITVKKDFTVTVD